MLHLGQWILGRRFGLAEHFGGDVARGDLAQGDDGCFVVFPGKRGLGAVRQAAGALGGEENELKEVLDVVQAVFDGNSGHV